MSGRFQWVWFISLTLPHRASMIWILGEYCDRIDEVEEILGSFLEGFQDESPQVLRTKKPSIHVPLFSQVQLQLLTSIVKLFLKKPTTTQELVQMVLTKATQVQHWTRCHAN